MAGERLPSWFSLRYQLRFQRTEKCFETATSHLQNVTCHLEKKLNAQMIRTSTDFYNYFMAIISIGIGIIQSLIYLTNYPNDFIELQSFDLLVLSNADQFPPELSLSVGGFFVIIGIVYLVLRSEGNKEVDSVDRRIIPKGYIGMIILMFVVNYVPIISIALIAVASIFGIVAKTENGK